MKAAWAHSAESLSPLAADLAVSRLSLAALRALGGSPPTEEERSCSARIRESLERQQARLESPATIAVGAVPRDDMRRELEETLSTLPYVTGRHRARAGDLNRLLGLLLRLEEGSLSEMEARLLLDALLALGTTTEPGDQELPEMVAVRYP